MPTPSTKPPRFAFYGGLVVAVVLAGQVAAGLWDGAGLLARDLRIEGWFSSEEARLERALGDRYPVLVALREITPPQGALIYCNLKRGVETGDVGLADMFLLQRLRHALHPSYVRELDFRIPTDAATLPSDPAQLVFRVGGRELPVFVCDFWPDLPGDPPPPFELRTALPGFEIWGVPE